MRNWAAWVGMKYGTLTIEKFLGYEDARNTYFLVRCEKENKMNNKETSIKKTDELVNRAQLAINDWQCSGDMDYLEKAVAYLCAALKGERLKEIEERTDADGSS